MAENHRPWFVYKDTDKNEIVSVQDVHDFNGIINRLDKIIKDDMVDIVVEDEFIDAIEASLPQGADWPRECCISLLLEASKKFKKTAKSDKYIRDESLYDAFSWIVYNSRNIETWYGSGEEKPERNAYVKCNACDIDKIKKELYLSLAGILDVLNNPDEALKSVHVVKKQNRLDVYYPVNEVYGYAFDYVGLVVKIFEELKGKYKDIAIHGVVYFLENISTQYIGYEFCCESNDKKLESKPLGDEYDVG